MTTNKSDRIKKYNKPLNINIGTMVFVVILLYIIVSLISFFNSKKVIPYEVKMGSLTESNVFRGLILREEAIVAGEYPGYINYFAREGERVGAFDLVCSIDETGQLKEVVDNENANNNLLSKSGFSKIKDEIVNFSSSFNLASFSEIYDFKHNIEGSVLKLSNHNILQNVTDLNESRSSISVNMCYAPDTGIVTYYTDGYESITPNMITSDSFNEEAYEKHHLLTNDLVSSGDIIYKLATSEQWSIMIETDLERAELLLAESYVRVKFLRTRDVSWGKVDIISRGEKSAIVQLIFNNSMLTYSTDRFIDIELILDDQKGLKVPNSAIIERNFPLIPQNYITKGGNGDSDGVLLKKFDEEGNSSITFVPISIINIQNDLYYIDSLDVSIGDIIVEPDSSNDYTLTKTGNLIGVYNINKGYADFRQIRILRSNDEYSIIESNTNYGLIVYDYIVLEANSVVADEFIY